MARPQGKARPQIIRDRIAHLLRTTDVSMAVLAQRFDCSVAFIGTLNRELKIRNYTQDRRQFTIEAA